MSASPDGKIGKCRKLVTPREVADGWGFFNSVIPTGADHRKAMICGAEGPAVWLERYAVGAEYDSSTKPFL